MSNNIRYGSVCSGVEAASVAWHSLGWTPAWLSEIAEFQSKVLSYRFPDVPNLGDMTKIAEGISNGTIEAPDILVGGTPCTSFSTAGLRQGMNDPRGQLTLHYVKILEAIDANRKQNGKQPAIALWENVIGVFSDKTNGFGNLLAALAGLDEAIETKTGKWPSAGVVCGPTRRVAWRVLDAKYFGVAARRRRVFVCATSNETVEHSTNLDPTKILAFSKAMQGNPRDCQVSWKDHTTGFTRCFDPSGRFPTCLKHEPNTIGNESSTAFQPGMMARLANQPIDEQSHTIIASINDNLPTVLTTTFQPGLMSRLGKPPSDELSHTLMAKSGSNHQTISSFTPFLDVRRAYDSLIDEQAPTLITFKASNVCITGKQILRRLTPVEYERLQGFPDDWTLIPWKRGYSTDEYRYQAMGNSMAVPVMKWLGMRIDAALTNPGQYNVTTKQINPFDSL